MGGRTTGAINAHSFYEPLRLFWATADRYVRRQLLFSLLLVGTAALLISLTPLALKMAVDSFGINGSKGLLLTPIVIIALYVRIPLKMTDCSAGT